MLRFLPFNDWLLLLFGGALTDYGLVATIANHVLSGDRFGTHWGLNVMGDQRLLMVFIVHFLNHLSCLTLALTLVSLGIWGGLQGLLYHF